MSPSGTSLLFSSYFGGSDDRNYSEGAVVALDSSGHIYLAGTTISRDFPTTPGVFQTKSPIGPSAFVAKISDATLTVSPSTLSFPSQTVGATSAEEGVTVSISGSAPLTVTKVQTQGNFAQTNSCGLPGQIPANTSCTIEVTFTPSASGPREGTLIVESNASLIPNVVTLSGTGETSLGAVGSTALVTTSTQPPTATNTASSPAVTHTSSTIPLGGAIETGSASLSLSTSALEFSSQTSGTTSAFRNITVKNTGDTPVSISSFAISNNFAQTNDCGSAIAPGSHCVIMVTFSPHSTGGLHGSLSITSNASGSPHTVTLSGVAVEAPPPRPIALRDSR